MDTESKLIYGARSNLAAYATETIMVGSPAEPCKNKQTDPGLEETTTRILEIEVLGSERNAVDRTFFFFFFFFNGFPHI